jgi:hypothetical protein
LGRAEFNFTIAAFHHALEAYKISDVIKANNISIATFSDLWCALLLYLLQSLSLSECGCVCLQGLQV